MKQENILITGSNGGIGLEIARYLLEKKHRNLACHYRSKSTAIETLLKSYDLDPAKHCFQADLNNEQEVLRMKENIQSSLGGVSSLLNVAGSSKNGLSWKFSVEDFQRVVNDSLLSSFICSKTFIPQMREKGWGRIVNFSSIIGFTGMAGAAPYCAAKAGLIGMTKAMSQELAAKGITVNAIALGYFNYGLINDVSADLQAQIKAKIPVARFGETADIGQAIQFLLHEESSFYTGQVLHLNGGQF